MTVLWHILRAVGWAVAGLLVLPFLIGYAAPYLPPAHFWWTNLFAVVLPPLGLGVGLLSVGLLGQGVYRRAWGRVVIAGMLLGLIIVRFVPHIPVGNASVAGTETLRLMTFNVPMTFARQEASARALGRFVQREDPDVLAFQESWVMTGDSPWSERETRSWPPRVFLVDSLGYALPQVHPRQAAICQPVFGRPSLDSISVHSMSSYGDSNWCSNYTRTAFTWQGRPVVLYNVHLHSIGSIRPWNGTEGWGSLDRWRAFFQTYREGALRRARQARSLLQRIEQETHPVLVAGDFNSTPHQWAYRHIAQGLQSVENHGAWGWNATYPARRPIVRIDHILAGPAWNVVTARVPVLKGDTTFSDHRPVVAQLRWRR